MSAKFFYGLLLLTFLSFHARANLLHPRSIIGSDDLPEIRERLNRQPYRALFENLQQLAINKKSALPGTEYNPYEYSSLMASQAFLYLLSGENSWAEEAYHTAEQVMADTVFFQNPYSFGLTRAALLKRIAYTYDFCYPAWTEAQRRHVNDQLYELMYSVNASMGRSANYSIESNWMGVRFGSVILASYVYDPPAEQDEKNNPALPLRWDAQKRLGEHLEQSIFSHGWNGESMSYHIYGWKFVGPALLALQHNLTNFQLEEYAPQTLQTLHGIMTSTVNIPHRGGKGIQADLSDDDLMFSTGGVLGMAFSLYPSAQQGALKWMHDYLIEPTNYTEDEEQLIYSLLFYPEDTEAQNPAEIGWLTYHDPQQGIVISRNRFRDENDVVSTYNAKATRIRGHAGPDANTFRLIGEGVPWIIGGGRTGLTAGQSNLFPAKEATAERDDKGLGTLHDYQFLEEDPDAYAIGSGSAVGTQDHQRIHYTSFSEETDASAIVIVKERSANGRRWRINTPEFNTLTEHKDGFLLTAPNGASMQVKFLEPEAPLRIESGKVRYGGETDRHNSGIWYRGKGYAHSRYIDVYCEGDVYAVISLQPAAKTHPEVKQMSATKIRVGDKEISLPGFEAALGRR
ncbi:MAG: hypothetical protein ACLFOZ_05555 [Cyclobacteriaceae bacterium]